MICPRCAMAQLVGEAQQCAKCGYSAVPVAVAVAERTAEHDPVDETARQELSDLFGIERVHRRGPASILYVALDLEWKARVALKVIARSPEAGAVADEGFHRAAAVAATLDHPHVVPVYSAGTTEHCFWYATEFVEGSSLSDLLRRGPMELVACLRLVGQIGRALAYAHQRGVVHADVKPANVLIDATGRARVTDFWVPWVLEQLGALRVLAGTEGAGPGRKTARQVEYLAPEELSQNVPGPFADQYSLAVLVYECMSGMVPVARPAVEGSTPGLFDVRPGVPRHVAQAVERALSREPGERFPGILDFVTALEAPAPRPSPRRAPPAARAQSVLFVPGTAAPVFTPRRVLLGALGLAILAGAGVVLRDEIAGAREALSRLSVRTSERTDTPIMPPVAGAQPDSVGPQPGFTMERGDAAPPPLLAPATALAASAPVTSDPSVAVAAAHDSSPAPSPGKSPAPSARSAPKVAPRRPVAPALGRLFINATPWGEVYIDGLPIGNTPKAAVPVAPGTHRVRVVREGFEAFERTIQVGSGQDVRLTDILLHELRP
jgi:eukaryotic-like serine/threonine-protein kinase